MDHLSTALIGLSPRASLVDRAFTPNFYPHCRHGSFQEAAAGTAIASEQCPEGGLIAMQVLGRRFRSPD